MSSLNQILATKKGSYRSPLGLVENRVYREKGEKKKPRLHSPKTVNNMLATLNTYIQKEIEQKLRYHAKIKKYEAELLSLKYVPGKTATAKRSYLKGAINSANKLIELKVATISKLMFEYDMLTNQGHRDICYMNSPDTPPKERQRKPKQEAQPLTASA